MEDKKMECKKAFDAIRKLYVELGNLDLNERFLGELFKNGVITNQQLRNLQAMPNVDEFWGIIQTSLKVNLIDTFDTLLKVMNASSNSTTNDLAKQLSEAADRPLPDVSSGEDRHMHHESIDGSTLGNVDEALFDKGKGGGAFKVVELLKYMECVCRIENFKRTEGATGFVMVDKDVYYIITCNHVIPDDSTAKSSSFMFNYIDAKYEPKRIKGSELFDMRAGKWFWTNENLNYTAIKLDKEKVYNITYARNEERLMEIEGITLPTLEMQLNEGDIFTIIQQVPAMKLCEGSCKQRKDESSAMLKYELNTSMGSGGAPIFKEHNRSLKLVAMHIGHDGNKLDYNCGVLVSEILKHMKEKPCSSMPTRIKFIEE